MAERVRRLTDGERALAWSVYRDSLRYDRVFISDRRVGTTAVTLAGVSVAHRGFTYRICWPAGFAGVMHSPGAQVTLIHELCHVWQGQHGVWPTLYMGQSILDQLAAGMIDIWRKRGYRGWDEHRAGAYTLNASDWGRDWRDFGVERQASIVESWYASGQDGRTNYGPGVTCGGMSELDPRFPYIRDVIRAGERDAPYRDR